MKNLSVIFSILLIFTFAVTIPNYFFPQIVNAESSEIPPWIKNTAKWWADGLTGDEDFKSAIKYLVDHRIIEINMADVMKPPAPDTTAPDTILTTCLTCNDFDGDGFADLAIGAPGESIGDTDNAGLINILYGSSSGLTAVKTQAWYQSVMGENSYTEANDQFGQSMR